MKILKFGGSSVGSSERIQQTMQIVADSRSIAPVPAIIVSAFQGVTDELITTANRALHQDATYGSTIDALEERHLKVVNDLVPFPSQSDAADAVKGLVTELRSLLSGVALLKELSSRTLDTIMSFGERLSALVIANAFARIGIDAEFLDARHVVRTDDSFGRAVPLFEETNALIKQHFDTHAALQVVTGFIGSTADSQTTTLGRGGSDYSASIFGAALQASAIEIWTDVDGVLTSDPRKVAKAYPIDQISYEEAMELSHFGAKVIYPPTMRPAMVKQIPLVIKNSFNPSAPGTLIGAATSPRSQAITGISSIDEIALMQLQGSGMVGVAGISMRLFSALARASVSVILITQASSEHTICFAVLPESAEAARRAISAEFQQEIEKELVEPPFIERGLAILSVVGEGMRSSPGIAAKLCTALAKNGVNISAIAQGSSERNISVVIRSSEQAKALNAVHDEFFTAHLRTVHLFVVGRGLIGSTLIKQLERHAELLKTEHFVELKLCGVTDSKRMLVRREGIPLDSVAESLIEHGCESSMQQFVRDMQTLNLPNSTFVDCTASDEVPRLYEQILTSHISVVTPNKRGQAGSLPLYRSIKSAAKLPGSTFLFETSVGAGLPVISTLTDLRKSGDTIVKIEAILSGTLSYIFNTFSAESSFSEVVLDARSRGFTEPDPREDLNGLDVGRKLLILAREAGAALELADISIENLIPVPCRTIPEVSDFLNALPHYDAEIEDRRRAAEKRGARLRYVATWERGTATVKLIEVTADHPFFNLSGSDNVVAFTTERYKTNPLVVKGPGAGAEVTAAGVFADIVRVALYA
jgi:aspartokinase/homoserine dehydrogenase 1